MDEESTVRFEIVEPGSQSEPAGESAESVGEGVDALLRRAAGRAPDRIAFADPPNRTAFGLGPRRTTNFAEADACADAIAARLVHLGLEPGDRVAIQLPNICEAPLLLAGAWRAGLTPVPLPMMWRLEELHHAFTQVGPAAVVTVGQFADHDYGATTREAADRHDAIRHVLSLGPKPEDGMVPVGDWFDSSSQSDPPAGPGAHDAKADGVAIMTWAAGARGPYPVPRSHRELAAVGRLAVRQLAITANDVLLNAYPLTTISSLGGQMIAALQAGASMILHQPFDYDGFVAQLRERSVTYTALPGPVIAALQERGDLSAPVSALTRIGCISPSPHDPSGEAAELETPLPVFDIHSLGELALLIEPRRTESPPPGLPLGKIVIPGGDAEQEVALETRVRGNVANGGSHRYLSGELLVRGSTVPAGPFDSVGPLTGTLFKREANGFVNTHIRCSVDETSAGRFRCERDRELIYHGGVAIGATELDRLYAAFPEFLDAAAFTIEDPVIGERIFAAVVPRADHSPSLDNLRQFLSAKGVAAYKAPDQLVIVNAIPRDGDGGVLRDQILKQI